MRRFRVVLMAGALSLAVPVFGVAVIAGVFTSEAVQGPSISLDMLPDGNAYDGATNTMTVGSVDSCLTAGAPGNDQQHSHTAHLVVRDVEDLVAWQARMNYDGGRMRPHAVNFTPFLDERMGQNVSFVNLPLDSGFHRDLIPAIQIPPPAAEPQTALIGSSYVNEQNAAVSADTPPKQPPDDSSYSAPSGGVLALSTLSFPPARKARRACTSILMTASLMPRAPMSLFLAARVPAA